MTNSPCSSRARDVLGSVEVALGIRRVLEELAVVVPVALRRLDLRRRLEVQHPLALSPRPDPGARSSRSAGRGSRPGRSAAARRSCRRRRCPRGRRASRRRRRCGRTGPRASPRPAGRSPKTTSLLKYSGIRPMIASPFGSSAAGLRQVVAVEASSSAASSAIRADRLDLVRPRRRHEVVEQRRSAGEALDPEQLLGVEAAVGRAVLGVALPGDAAVADVVHGIDWPPSVERRPV